MGLLLFSIFKDNTGLLLFSIFNYNKVLSTLPVSKDGNLLACDCKENFPKFVYKPHVHVHTGDVDLVEITSQRNIMKNLEKRHHVINISWPIYTGMPLKS